MFYLAGVGLAFFLTLLLISKRHKTLADQILTGWLAVVTVHLLLYYFLMANLYPQFLGLGIPLPLFHGPFLYAYTVALTNRTVRMKTLMIHFALPIAVYAYLIPFLLSTAEEKIRVFQSEGVEYATFNMINSIAIVVSGVLYIILASLVLRKHRQAIMQEFSSTEKINLLWLQYLIVWLAAIWVFVIMSNDALVFGAAVLFVLFIGFFGIRQVGIFHSMEKSPDPSMDASELVPESDGKRELVETGLEKKKYQKSGLSAEESESIQRELIRLMETEKLFRESELSLSDLSERLNTQPNYLSQVINEREGKNFYDYINSLRIAEFKRLAAGPDSRKYTLMGLAQECGFNSKSSFNRHFRKITGQSPSEFIQAIQESKI